MARGRFQGEPMPLDYDIRITPGDDGSTRLRVRERARDERYGESHESMARASRGDLGRRDDDTFRQSLRRSGDRRRDDRSEQPESPDNLER